VVERMQAGHLKLIFVSTNVSCGLICDEKRDDGNEKLLKEGGESGRGGI
jgi:hypothetical protein